MSWDTKYRPLDFDGVIGQENVIEVLKQAIISGTAFHHSYLFEGPWGSGKTTNARIFARGMLCDSPVGGNPCNHCPSCVAILNDGASENFVEFDAATNSGKADIKKLVEETTYSSFSGKRRIYLIDEAHQLSRDALDALLKPLEENILGSDDKKMVCIFCTTEPEKMRKTIISRCAPSFKIKYVTPDQIAERLAFVCNQEGVQYEPDVLPLIAEITECHIRDALKSLEGIAMVGDINQENVASYLHLNLNDLMVDLLAGIEDPSQAIGIAESLLVEISPLQIYERLAEVAMQAYRLYIGASKKLASFWNTDKLRELGEKFGNRLVEFSIYLASRPAKPSASMLLCDLAHMGIAGELLGYRQAILTSAAGSKKPASKSSQVGKIDGQPLVEAGLNQNNVFVDPKASKRDLSLDKPVPIKTNSVAKTLSVPEFCRTLEERLAELGEDMAGGLPRQPELGGDRAEPVGGD